jgi:hypothetical protein
MEVVRSSETCAGIHNFISQDVAIFIFTAVRTSNVTYYELDNRRIGVRFPAEARYFSVLYSFQTDPGFHPAFYTVGI